MIETVSSKHKGEITARRKGVVMKDCFGKIFPDLSRVENNKLLAGKVFKVRINCTGMMPQSRQLESDLQAWEECQRCEQYRGCFDLSIARLAIQGQLSRI